MGLFLGIDGGGSRTQALLGDERGRILARAVAGPSNPTKVGMDAAKKELLRVARTALRGVSAGAASGELPLAAVCAGVAGVDRPSVSRPLLAWLRRAIPARGHLLVTDMAITLHAALGTAAGMIVESGTGSFAYARTLQGETLRAGGWGSTFDDPGSGYDLGRKAIMAGLRDYDGRGGHTVLTSRICQSLKLSDITHIVTRKLNPQQVAALFPLVLGAAREGDRVARGLCSQAAFELAEMALALSRRLGWRGPVTVVCAGGIFRASPTLRRRFARIVHQHLPLARVRLLQREPVEGALSLARELGG